MNKYDQLLENYKRKLNKALQHLDYSYQKVILLSSQTDNLDNETLEVWESFSARFGRVSDLFLTKYLRTFVLKNDPGFEGSLRDFINQAEKLRLIENVDPWIEIRELRNISAHDYTEEELSLFFDRLRKEAPLLLGLKKLFK